MRVVSVLWQTILIFIGVLPLLIPGSFMHSARLAWRRIQALSGLRREQCEGVYFGPGLVPRKL